MPRIPASNNHKQSLEFTGHFHRDLVDVGNKPMVRTGKCFVSILQGRRPSSTGVKCLLKVRWEDIQSLNSGSFQRHHAALTLIFSVSSVMTDLWSIHRFFSKERGKDITDFSFWWLWIYSPQQHIHLHLPAHSYLLPASRCLHYINVYHTDGPLPFNSRNKYLLIFYLCKALNDSLGAR